MSPLWLIGLPLAGAAAAALLQRWGRLAAMVVVFTSAACVFICRSLPPQSTTVLFRQNWTMDASTQLILTYSYAVATVLLAIGALRYESATFLPAILACLGALGAALWLNSTWLSLIVLAAAMLLPALGSAQGTSSSIRGATRYLIWVTVPIPFLLTIPALLEQVSVHPQELEWYGRCAWLLVPAAVFWLNLFPLDAAMSLWANDAAPLMPAFVWLVQQVVVLNKLMELWETNPLLWTQPTVLVVRAFALLTVLLSGVVATIQLSLPAVLGSAAMATFGLAVLGILSGTGEGLAAARVILAGRSVAVLAACAALQVAYLHPGSEVKSVSTSSRLVALATLTVVTLAVAAVVLLPMVPLMDSRTSLLSLLSASEWRLPSLWTLSVIGVLIGIARTSWSLWRARLARSGQQNSLLAMLLIGLLLLFLTLNQQALVRIASYILPD